MADGRHLEFRFLAIIWASINIFAPNLVHGWKINTLRQPIGQKRVFRKSNMADGYHLEFRLSAIISASIDIFAPNLAHRWKINTLRWSIGQKSRFQKKIQDGGRQPFLISNFGHNFGANQYLCTKFRIHMENQQPKETHWSQINFRKSIIWAMISASIKFLHHRP